MLFQVSDIIFRQMFDVNVIGTNQTEHFLTENVENNTFFCLNAIIKGRVCKNRGPVVH